MTEDTQLQQETVTEVMSPQTVMATTETPKPQPQKKASSLLTPRQTYKPFMYPQAFEFWTKQQLSHWTPHEVQMTSDIQDFNFNLTEAEKSVVAGILKGFVQSEIVIGEFWSSRVSQWFQHPEIQMMAHCFSDYESIHTVAYSYLQDSLAISDYEAFLQEPTAKARIDRLIDVPINSSKENIALSLAIFSAFAEGVSLFSAFAVLFNFSRFNKLKGVGQLISWSILDEIGHSTAGCYLFRELIKENPEIWTDELKKSIYEAARLTVQLKDSFIDKIFEKGPIQGMDPKDLKVFIRYRTNIKLGDLGLKQNWKNIDKEALANLSWFDVLAGGISKQDFFSGRETAYSKNNLNLSNIFDVRVEKETQ